MGVNDKCAAEFSLRRHQNPRIYATTMTPPLESLNSDDSANLKIIAVLREISDSLIRGNIDEGMLDLLETLEKLQEDSVFMESLKSAYCWSAVESTLRFMWPENASDGLFSESFERIWRNRIGMLKEKESDLVNVELLNWESDLEKAFEEPEMYKKIREMNIRYNAMSHLNHLVKEQLDLLGCSAFKPDARKMLLKRNDSVRGENVGRDSVNEDVGIDERVVRNGTSRDDVNEGGGVDEQQEEHEPGVDNGDRTVARELKAQLLEIQGVVGVGPFDPSTMIGQETNDTVYHSIDVTPQPNQANKVRRGRRKRSRAEDKQVTLASSSSSGRVRPYLPTPVPLNVSPLKVVKPATARPRRRPVRFWTNEEVEALMEGMREHGKSWKAIKDSNPLVLADRTEVDLKDKWRNLMKRQ